MHCNQLILKVPVNNEKLPKRQARLVTLFRQTTLKAVCEVSNFEKPCAVVTHAGPYLDGLKNGVIKLPVNIGRLVSSTVQHGPRRLSENREPTAEKLNLASFFHSFR